MTVSVKPTLFVGYSGGILTRDSFINLLKNCC